MTVTVRLDAELEEQLENLAEQTGRSKSDLIREGLREYVERNAERPTAWETGQEFVGQVSSGRSDLSRNHSKILKEMLRARSRRS